LAQGILNRQHPAVEPHTGTVSGPLPAQERTLMKGRGMGSFCSTTSSVISSVSRVNALSATCRARAQACHT